MDALGLDKVAVAGACVGGWIAAELAMRHPERVTHLVLIGASGLEIPDQPIGDLFWEAQPRNGTDYSGMRRLLFGRDDAAEAVRLFPDSRGEVGREHARYKTMRFASRIGFNPPYFHDRHLRRRLHRYGGPSLVLWGEHDRMVPRAHGAAYAKGLAAPRSASSTVRGTARRSSGPRKRRTWSAPFSSSFQLPARERSGRRRPRQGPKRRRPCKRKRECRRCARPRGPVPRRKPRAARKSGHGASRLIHDVTAEPRRPHGAWRLG